MSVNLHITVHNWLRELKFPTSKNYIKQQLNFHPDFPSLLSITDTLDELGIENTAIQIAKEKLYEIPVPFIAHLNGSGGEFVVINSRDNFEKQIPNFFQRWGGVLIAAEKSRNWEHKENSLWLAKAKKHFTVITLALILMVAFIISGIIISFSWLQTGLLMIAVAGVFVSWMIITKEFGIENKIADHVCGKEADCDTVINSKTIKLPLNIGWSDAGLIYFSFLLTLLLINSFAVSNTSIYFILSALTTLAIPVTILSFYYQWQVVKKWCRLCLITAALLWFQFFLFLPYLLSFGQSIENISLNNILLAAFLLFFTAAAWLLVKSLLKENKKLETENFTEKRFKNNPDIFNALLVKQKKLTVMPNGLGITIGNLEATNTIIKVCNPYCGPCAKAHLVIDKLLAEKNNLKVQILFTAGDDEKDLKSKPVKHLMALNEIKDKQFIQKALDDWYMADKKDYDAFAEKYKLNGELEKQGEKLKAMRAWCDEVKIEFTPTFFINGYQLPKQYTIEEVKYFLEK